MGLVDLIVPPKARTAAGKLQDAMLLVGPGLVILAERVLERGMGNLRGGASPAGKLRWPVYVDDSATNDP
jgi:hypothetical protein